MNKRAIKLSAIALGAALACSSAFAQETPSVTFSGFGTIGAVHSNNDQVDFVSNARQPRGAGASRSTSFAPDSLVAVQANARFSSSLSGVAQVISQRQDDGTFRPGIEWAFVKYQAAPNLDFTIGRTALPAFAVSDSRLLGYSNLMVRPPVDVYFGVPLTHLDGVGASWRHDTSLGQLTLQGNFGNSNAHFPNGAKVKGENLVSASASLETGPVTWRAGYTTTKLTYHANGLNALVGGYNQYGSGLMAMGAPANFSQEAYDAANFFNIDGRRASFADLGIAYDQGPWIAQAEITRRKVGSLVPTTRSWHASAGYRIGKVTPYLGFSRLETLSSTTNAPVLSAITPTASALNGLGAGALLASGTGQRTSTVGVKWNFRDNMDLKVQYDDVHPTQNFGTFTNTTGAAFAPSRVGLTSVAVDFVF